MGKMLFIRGGAVGDFILTMPAIKLVRDSLPDLEIEILGYESIASLAVEAGLADEVRSIEHATLAPFFAPGAKLDEETCQYFSDFDVVISYLYDPDGFFGGNLERAGVETLIKGPYKIDESEPFVPAAKQLAEPLEQLALFIDDPWVEVSFSNDEIDDEEPLIALHPGSGSPAKNWSYEKWAELVKRIHDERPEASFLIISGEAEAETIHDFLGLLQTGDIPYCHLDQLPLPEVGTRLESCEMFFGHDSGIGHLAASVGIPGLVLFGPTRPEIWAPLHPSFNYRKAPGGQLGHLTVEEVHEAYASGLSF